MRKKQKLYFKLFFPKFPIDLLTNQTQTNTQLIPKSYVWLVIKIHSLISNYFLNYFSLIMVLNFDEYE